MTDTLFNFIVFWGVWLLVPMMVDGGTTIFYLVGVWRSMHQVRCRRNRDRESFFPPFVTIIIPVYNGEDVLGPCLESIRRQNYPQENLQVIVVNNGSTDGSFQVFCQEQSKAFEGIMTWMDIDQRGKVHALNAGIHLAHGTLIINIDCDTVLHPDSVGNTARAFHEQPDLAAATGSIAVLPAGPSAHLLERLTAECEALEYMFAFFIGRQYQATHNSLFTLAGAYSAFRQETLLATYLYDRKTVSEDTKLTLDIHRHCAQTGMRVGCIPDAIAYVEPTTSIAKLYAQRVRWQRGELEVAALQNDLKTANILRTKGLSVPRVLLVDHTLAFPRLAWTLLLPMLYTLGYPMGLVVGASIGMYIFYSLMESLSMVTCFLLGTKEMRWRIMRAWYLWALMPAYRFVLFWFRFGGFLNVLTEDAQWKVSTPWEETGRAARKLWNKLRFGRSGSDRSNVPRPITR